jgi:hypothetical protein
MPTRSDSPSKPPPKRVKTTTAQAIIGAAPYNVKPGARAVPFAPPPPPPKRMQPVGPVAVVKGPRYDPLKMLTDPKQRGKVAYTDLAKLAPVSTQAQKEIWRRTSPGLRKEINRPTPPAPKLPWEYKYLGKPVAKYTAGFVLPTGAFKKNAEQLISSFPSMARAVGGAVGSDIYNLTQPDYKGVPLGHTLALGRDIVVGTVEQTGQFMGLTSLDPYIALAHGDYKTFIRKSGEQQKKAVALQQEQPINAALTFLAVVAGPARMLSISKLADSIEAANPGLSKIATIRLATRESYRPGYLATSPGLAARYGLEGDGILGGIPHRTVTMRVAGGGDVTVATRKAWSRQPTWRGMQRGFDRWSAKLPADTRWPVSRFSEQKRAINQIQRKITANTSRTRLNINQMADDMTKFVKGTGAERLAVLVGRKSDAVKARMAVLTTALQGPEHEDALTAVQAAVDDLKQTLEEGAKDIPTNARVSVEERIVQLDQEMEQMGLAVHEDQMWQQLRDTLGQTSMDAPEPGKANPPFHTPEQDANIEVVKHAARVWAQEQPGRNPADYLSSPEGAHLGAILAHAPGNGWSNQLLQSLYHGSAEGDFFLAGARPGFHIGTAEAAADRLAHTRPSQNAHYFPGTFEHEALTNPYETTTEVQFKPGARILDRTVHDTPDEGGHGVQDYNPVQRQMVAYDYDAIAYINNVEHPGSVSYYVMNPNAVEHVVPEVNLRNITEGVDMKAFRGENFQGVNDLLRDLPRLLEEGKAARFWYEQSARKILDATGGDKEQAWKVAQIVAIYSAQRTPMENINLMTEVIRQAQLGKITTGTKDQIKKANAVLRGESWAGRKTDRFYKNIIDDIDHQRYLDEFHGGKEPAPGAHEVTNDIWVARMFGLKTKVPTKAEYEAISRILNNVADQLGWKPKHVQAATWGPVRATRGRKKMTVEEAGKDFSHALEEESAVLGIEAAPSGLDAWTNYSHMSQRERSMHDIRILDATQQLMSETGLLGHIAPQPRWEEMQIKPGEMFSPEENVQYSVYIPTKMTKEAMGKASAQALNTAASLIAESLGRKEMMWFRPKFAKTIRVMDRNGVKVTGMVRKLSNDEINAVKEIISEKTGIKKKDIEVPPGSHFDFHILRTDKAPAKGPMSNKSFQQAVAETLDFFDNQNLRSRFFSAPVGRVRRRADGSYPHTGSSWARRPVVQRALVRYRQSIDDLWRELGYDTPIRREPAGERVSRAVQREGRPPGPLTQQAAVGVKGAIDFAENNQRLMYLLERGDTSTFLHELVGHSVPELRLRFPEEFKAVEDAMKVPYEQWRPGFDAKGRPLEHEKFAQWTERYFREGKAPTPEAAAYMDILRGWMRQVYELIKMLGTRPIPIEARDLLDRFMGAKPRITPEERTALANLERNLKRATDAGDESKAAYHRKRLDNLKAKIEERPRESVFDEDKQRVVAEYGQLLAQRQDILEKEAAQALTLTHEAADTSGRDLMDAVDPDRQGSWDAAARAYDEIARRRKGAEGEGKPSESERLLDKQIKQLEYGIQQARDPEAGFKEALTSLVTISEMSDDLLRKTILDAAPEEVRPAMEAALLRRRNLLVTRWREKGLLPYGTGDALGYFPHASLFESLGDRLKGAVRRPQGSSHVLGKPQVTKVAARKGKNKLVLWQAGRVNMNPKVLLNTIHARVRLQETREMRDFFWQVGRPVKFEHGSLNVPEGWYVINRNGKFIPDRLRRQIDMPSDKLDELIAKGQDFDSNLETRKGMDQFLQDYKDSFAKKVHDMPDEWHGADVELRAVPPELVEGLLPKPFAMGKGGWALPVWDMVQAGVRVATILQYPIGYFMSNVPANVLLHGMTDTPSLFRDTWRSYALRGRDPKLYRKLAVEAGDIMAEAGLPDFYARAQGKLEHAERATVRTQRKWAEIYGEHADTPFRVASFLGWAHKYGFKSDEQLRHLVDGKGPNGQDLTALRDQLSQRTREDMIDFNTLSLSEREIVSRVFFLWPLVRGMAKWPVMFAREHPYKALALAQGGNEDFQRKHGYADLGTWRQRASQELGVIPLPGGKGLTIPGLGWNVIPSTQPGEGRGIDITGVSPVSGIQNIVDAMRAPEALTRGDIGAIRDTVASMATPTLREFLKSHPSVRTFLDSAIPGLRYVTSATSDKSRGSKIWKREKWWSYMTSRNVRFLPEEVDAAELQSQADRWRREQAGTTKAEEDKDALYNALPVIMHKSGYNSPATLKKIHTNLDAYYYMSGKVSGLSSTQKVELVNETVRKYFPAKAGLLHDVKPSTTEKQKDAYYNYWRDQVYATKNWVEQKGKDQKVLK